MTTHKGIVVINKVPTVVETWGRWIEETPAKDEEIILCIPGNPGVTSYYRKFLATIHEKTQRPVWIVGHAGHQIINNKNIKVPQLKGNEKLYNLEGQVEHKEAFFRKYIPDDARVFLVGHSIGSYIGLNLLDNTYINARVNKSYFLFPTIENMEETPNGKFLMNIISHITFIIFFLSWIFTLLPTAVQMLLLNIYFKITGSPIDNSSATKDLIHPAVLNKIFFMAFDEMEVVHSVDSDWIIPNRNRIKLYYGATDNWAPASYYREIVRKFPDVDAELCTRKFDHAFVLRSSVEVGNMVAGWIGAKV